MTTSQQSTPIEVKMAIGQVLRMMSRPFEPGDIETYYACRTIVLDYAEATGVALTDHAPNYFRDMNKGAQGDR